MNLEVEVEDTLDLDDSEDEFKGEDMLAYLRRYLNDIT